MLYYSQNRFHIENCSFTLPDGVYLLCNEACAHDLTIRVPNASWQLEISFEQLKNGASQFFLEEEDREYFQYIGDVQSIWLNNIPVYYLQYGNANAMYSVYHFSIAGNHWLNVFEVAVRMDPLERYVDAVLQHPVITSFLNSIQFA